MKTKTIVRIAILLTMVGGPRAQERPREALDGTDPVLLVRGKDVLGKAEFKAVHESFEYLFASAETKAEFEKNPAQYAVQFGGLCARMGGTAAGNLSDYAVHDGKIYVFGSDTCRKVFVAAPAKFIPAAAEPFPTDRAALQRGRQLLDRAAGALGGSRLDAMTSYVEHSTQIVSRMEAEVPVKLKATWRFPDDVRVERVMKMDDQVMSSATLVTRHGAWYLGHGQAYPMIAAAHANASIDQRRQLLPLLRSRRNQGFLAASLGRATAGGSEVERVRVKDHDLDVVLSVDPASGQPRSLAFTDRGAEGEFGLYTLDFADFKATDGITMPFRVRASFNNQPEPSRSRTVDSVQINAAIDPTIFNPTPKQ